MVRNVGGDIFASVCKCLQHTFAAVKESWHIEGAIHADKVIDAYDQVGWLVGWLVSWLKGIGPIAKGGTNKRMRSVERSFGQL